MSDVGPLVPAVFAGIAVFFGYRLIDVIRPSEDTKRRTERPAGLLIAAAAFVAGWLVGAVFSGIPIFGLPVGLMAAGLPTAVLSRRRMERQRRARAAWPDALRLLNAYIVAGSPIHRAMLRLEIEGPDVLAPFWSRYRRLSSTEDPVSALIALKLDQSDPFVDRLLEVLVQAIDAGPAIAVELIADLASSVSEDLMLEMQITSSNLEQRINARVIGYLPTAALFLTGLSNEPYREFYRSSTGAAVVIAGSALSLVGLLVVAGLARTPVEDRLFTVGDPA